MINGQGISTIIFPLQALMMLSPLHELLSPLLVVSESIATINTVSSALIRKGVSTMLFPLQGLLMLFPLQVLLFRLQLVFGSMATIYIMSSALIRYSSFMTLMGNTMPREFITRILCHRLDHQYIATRSVRRGDWGTMPFGSSVTPGQAVCLILWCNGMG